MKFQYTPMNDFRLEIGSFSHFILEVVSVANKSDLWRMILQASCLARLGNRLRGSNSEDPVIVLAVYIDASLQAHQYLLYQPDPGNKKVRWQMNTLLNNDNAFQVSYKETVTDLTRPKSAFEFIFRLYNFLSRAVDDNLKLADSLMTELEKIKDAVPGNHYPALTSGRKRKRDGGGGGGGADTPRQHPAPSPLGDPSRSLEESLKAAGYELMPTDSMLVPITQVSGSHVLVKRSKS
jgi:hypothetical protein